LRKAKEAADEAQAEVDLFQANCREPFAFLEAQTSKVEEVIPTPKVEEVISTTAPDVTIGGC